MEARTPAFPGKGQPRFCGPSSLHNGQKRARRFFSGLFFSQAAKPDPHKPKDRSRLPAESHFERAGGTRAAFLRPRRKRAQGIPTRRRRRKGSSVQLSATPWRTSQVPVLACTLARFGTTAKACKRQHVLVLLGGGRCRLLQSLKVEAVLARVRLEQAERTHSSDGQRAIPQPECPRREGLQALARLAATWLSTCPQRCNGLLS